MTDGGLEGRKRKPRKGGGLEDPRGLQSSECNHDNNPHRLEGTREQVGHFGMHGADVREGDGPCKESRNSMRRFEEEEEHIY